MKLNKNEIFNDVLGEVLKFKSSAYFCETYSSTALRDIKSIIEGTIDVVDRVYRDELEKKFKKICATEKEHQISVFEDLKNIPKDQKTKIIKDIFT